MSYSDSHLPNWGHLPVEQYMIVSAEHMNTDTNYRLTNPQRNWDYGCPQPASIQRMQLIAEFMSVPIIPRAWYHPQEIITPTEAQVNLILRPWRGPHIRQLAWCLWTESTFWPTLMRTHYDSSQPGDDVMMDEWAALGKMVDPDSLTSPFYAINDASFFGIREVIPHEYPDWRRIFALFPEIAGPEAVFAPEQDTIRWSVLPPWQKYRIDAFKRQLAFEKNCKPGEWFGNPYRMIEMCAAGIHYAMAAAFIIVVDRHAFTTGHPLLVYVDHHGQLIRSTRFELTEKTLLSIADDWFRGNLTPWMWEDSEVGEMYEVKGEIGQVLYQLDETDLAPPDLM
ncbi:uncharacterized protein N7484_000223 [Penicillium longicatenatum]|uniref:uncharacterized protein n=1 Tax=Penicillium longicatenatum TaxID=1561947 RepID=UPI0025479561|nr:uncharacterized protein N7484_000223 [Penicillium longicatenatum]KAJ5660851.1 hypothetical protein N7484_000223 [Penicillium longicatenatum]